MVEMSLTGIQYLYTDCTDYHSLGPTLAGGWQSCGAEGVRRGRQRGRQAGLIGGYGAVGARTSGMW